VAFIDANRSLWGVQPICKVLKFALSTYYACLQRGPSARALRDDALKVFITETFEANYRVYGARKLWVALGRAGHEVARCTVERLMRELGICGATRGKSHVRTTIADESCARLADLVKRRFTADGPNRLWCADITYVKTRAGWAYTAFVTDVFSRMIVGWKVSHSFASDLATDALQMTLSQPERSDELVHHSDRGVQYLSVSYSAALLAAGLRPSVGTTGDSYDNALAKRMNGLYKTELIRAVGVPDDERAVEWETCKWVHWYNTTRLHSAIGMMSLAESEALYYAQEQPVDRWAHRWPGLHKTRGGSKRPQALHLGQERRRALRLDA